MSRFAAIVRLDVRLQRRYGFYYAAGFSALVWIAALRALPDSLTAVALPLAVFVDLAVVGFFFIAGSMFFEKGERTLFALVVTPLRFWEYLAAKLMTLTALALVVSVVVVVAAHGLAFDLPLLVLGVLLTSLLMLLVGFVSSAPFSSVTEWLIPSGFLVAGLMLPLVQYAGLWQSPLFYAIPTLGSLMLFGGAFGMISLSAWQVAYAVVYLLVWVLALGVLARRVFDRYVVGRAGGP